MVALLGLFLWTGYEVNTQLQEYQEARAEYADLREQFWGSWAFGNHDTPPPEGELGIEGVDNAESDNFDALRVLHPGTVGWIVVPETGISYPIVQGSDNNRYLHHTFLGVRNNSGAIFIDFRNAADFSDPHTIVYGHNMRDGSMFAPLHGWDGDHFIIYTPDGMMAFEVFDRQIVQANDELFQLRSPPTDNGARVVMLSTCVTGRPSVRYVIQARLWDN